MDLRGGGGCFWYGWMLKNNPLEQEKQFNIRILWDVSLWKMEVKNSKEVHKGILHFSFIEHDPILQDLKYIKMEFVYCIYSEYI